MSIYSIAAGAFLFIITSFFIFSNPHLKTRQRTVPWRVFKKTRGIEVYNPLLKVRKSYRIIELVQPYPGRFYFLNTMWIFPFFSSILSNLQSESWNFSPGAISKLPLSVALADTSCFPAVNTICAPAGTAY